MWTRSIRIQYALPEFVLHPVPNSNSYGHTLTMKASDCKIQHTLVPEVEEYLNSQIDLYPADLFKINWLVDFYILLFYPRRGDVVIGGFIIV